jgi:hypothetical protein
MNGTVGRLWKVSAIYDNCSIMRISDMTKFWKRRCWSRCIKRWIQECGSRGLMLQENQQAVEVAEGASYNGPVSTVHLWHNVILGTTGGTTNQARQMFIRSRAKEKIGQPFGSREIDGRCRNCGRHWSECCRGNVVNVSLQSN